MSQIFQHLLFKKFSSERLNTHGIKKNHSEMPFFCIPLTHTIELKKTRQKEAYFYAIKEKIRPKHHTTIIGLLTKSKYPIFLWKGSKASK